LKCICCCWSASELFKLSTSEKKKKSFPLYRQSSQSAFLSMYTSTVVLLFGGLLALCNALPNITCCNGGVPYVDLHVWPVDGNRFEEIADEAECRQFVLQISDSLLDKFVENDGTLTCKCPRDFYGAKCTLNRQAQSWGGGDGQSFKMFLLLAVIPLTFALIAAVGGFFCKMCCCQIVGFECLNLKWTVKRSKENTFDNGEMDYPFSVRRTPVHSTSNLYVVNSAHHDQTAPSTLYEDPYDHGPPPAYESVVRQPYLQPPPQFPTIEKKMAD
ncbi:hypothetical protein T4E_6842, partial [Trichinella pseudospiralis]